MLASLNAFLEVAVGYVWGLPLVAVLCGTGLLLTLVFKGLQFRAFAHAVSVVRGCYDDPNDPGQITHFQALCTALSATVGLGNISGVAVAIHVGGPGATFWMIATGVLGMITKFAECSLSILYRRVDEHGEVHGGPMHYIELGLGPKWKPMAVFFAFACAFSAVGIGNMFQTHEVAAIFHDSFGIPHIVTGALLAIFAALAILGGIKRIAHVTSFLVPIMAVIYIGGALVVILWNLTALPDIFYHIVEDAFTGSAAQGAFAGIAVRFVIIQGVKRACFSNEAGLGSAPIAHSAASTKEPIREGLVAMLGPFIDTVVVCTMTALVILVSGVWASEEANGVTLTAMAFDSCIPGFGKYFVPVAVLLFAYSTLISWSYYGERAWDYMFGAKGSIPYRFFYCLLPVVGALWKLGPLLNMSDILLGLMVIPNLTAVLLMLPRIQKETKIYFEKLHAGQFKKHF
ncbi:MAG: alanine:cation symporter family protein [Bdellovibrionales bacterium]|nr:alanine:cation symporter family protein [Bdellovibrionales bacterium]